MTSQPNKNKFELTSDPSVSGMTCVWELCPTLLVKGESHQHINLSAPSAFQSPG